MEMSRKGWDGGWVYHALDCETIRPELDSRVQYAVKFNIFVLLKVNKHIVCEITNIFFSLLRQTISL